MGHRSVENSLLYWFLHRNRLATLVAKQKADHIELGEFVPELAMRTRDAQHVSSTISHGLQRLRSLTDFRAKDRLAALLA